VGGGNVTLTWTSANAASASIDQGVGAVAVNGSTTVNVTASKTFTLTLTNAAGSAVTYSAAVTVAVPPVTGSVVYGDTALTPPWSTDGSYSETFDFANKEQVLKGTTSMKVVASAWAGLQFRHGTWAGTTTVDATQYDSVHVAFHGGTAGVQLAVNLADASGTLIGVQQTFSIPANVWTIKSFPMSVLNAAKTPFTIMMVTVYQSAAATFYVDDFSLIAKAAAVVVPAAPTFVYPVPLSVNNPTSVNMTWTKISGATTYHVQMSTDSTFKAFTVNDSTLTDTVHAITSLSNGTKYYRRIRAKNTAGWGSFCSLCQFTTIIATPAAPVLASPANGATGQPLSVVLTWNAATGAATYRVQLATDSLFTTLVADDSTPTAPTKTVGSLVNGKKYYWRVNAKNVGGTSAYSAIAAFTTIIAAPATPVLGSPVNGATNQALSLALNWTASAGAATYRVQLATDSLFTTLIADDSTPTAPTKTVSSLVNGKKYYWRVNAKNVGGTSAFSAFSAFTTVPLISVPSVPVAVSPVNGSTNQAIALTLSWQASAGASTYRVQFAADSLFTMLLANDSTITTTSYAVASLSNLTQYFWRINAKNASGTSAFTATQKFTTLPYVKTKLYFAPITGTGNNATVAIPATTVFSIGGATLVSGDEIGAFTPAGLCVGSVEWNGASTALTVWGDNSQTTAVDGIRSGETIQYRVYRQASNTVYALVTAQYSVGLGMYQPDGLSTLAALTTATTAPVTLTQSIALTAGWNMISSNVKPNKTAIDSLTAQLSPNMTIVKNGAGLVYWPSVSINTLGFWNYTNGYMIYMAKAGTMNVTGEAIAPETTPISLLQGWNLAPFVRSASMNVATAVANLGSSVTVVKNNAGQVYWPAYGINTLGSMVAGQAYQMYLTQAASLVYPSNALAKSGDEPLASVQNVTVHFPALSQRGGSNEIVLVKDAGFQNGDEIAVRTSKNILAGTGVVNNGSAIVTVWADDAYTTDVVEGAVDGEVLSIVRWSISDGKEHAVAVSSLTDGLTGAPMTNGLVFTPNGVAVAVTAVEAMKTVPSDYSLLQNYPNPFNPSTMIKYALPADGMVTLKVYNSLGAEVATLVSGTQASGMHEVSFNASGLSSGIYFYTLRSGAFTKTQRMMLLK
jgi:hypothetical protein